ncbi:hypothetical protein JTB14_027951 [Gonioctena quinquepunctata]|nr:hypothetical protein JTB14_027951 [Gonioctena quinquepunctata]
MSEAVENNTVKKHQTKRYSKQDESELQDKLYQSSNSPLLDIVNENDFGRTMYNLFAAHIFLMISTSMMRDYIMEREIGIFQLMYLKFGKLDRCLWLWLGYNMVTFLSYLPFKFWATARYALKPSYIEIWDKSGILILSWFYITFFYYTYRIIYVAEMGTASNTIISMESLRMAMKIYAFVRSNVPKVLRGKCNGKIIEIPHFSKFLYFIHAPTLVYRDGFPR